MVSIVKQTDFEVVNRTMQFKLNPYPSLVMITTKNKDAMTAEKMFASVLAKGIRGISFYKIDLSANPSFKAMATGSSTEIRTVPDFIMYNGRIPIGRFKGDISVPTIEKFVTSMVLQLQQTQPQQSFVGHQNMYGGGYPQQQHIPQQPQQAVHQSISGDQVEEDEDVDFIMPKTGIAHNTPWETSIRKINKGKY